MSSQTCFKDRSSIYFLRSKDMSESVFGTQCLPVDDIVCRISTWIWRIVPVICLIVRTFGNITSVIILLRNKFRSKPCFVLIFVAIADALSLWCVFAGDALRFGYDFRLEKISVSLCFANAMLLFTVSSIQFWVIAIFTISRALFALFPHRSNLHLNRNRCIVAIFGAFFGITALFGTLYAFKEDNGDIAGNQTMNTESQNATTSCYSISYDTQSLDWILEMSGFILCLFVPCMIVASGNFALIYKFRRRPNYSEADKAQIYLLFSISALMAVTTLPYGIFYIALQIFHQELDTSSPSFTLIYTIIENVGYCNYSLNFFFYLWKCSLFKTEFETFLEEIKSKITRS